MSELSELFDRDPLQLSEQDIATIVARMREAQSQFELGVKTPKAPKPKAPGKGEKLLGELFGSEPKKDDPLGDLGL
jgi:hypothetical protein